MSYTITYPWDKEKKLLSKERSLLPYLPGTLILCGILVLRLLDPEVTAPLEQLLHPLTDEATIQVFGELTADLMDGTPFREAFAAFCREIISNG